MEINRLPIEWRGFGDYDDVTEANAVLLAIDIASREAIAADLRSLPDITSTSSGESYIEVRPVGVTKASGLMEVINLLEIEASEVLAVGDNDNDTEMLQWAGIGVVVANATPSAIAAADFISARESAQGVIETLRLVQNSRRLFRDEWQPRSGLEKNKQFPDTF
jgi:hydroxymethylpyrimidine pyrophosphatase-like HAD family hydrolase